MLNIKLKHWLDQTDENLAWFMLALVLLLLALMAGWVVVDAKPLPQKATTPAKRPVRKVSLGSAPAKAGNHRASATNANGSNAAPSFSLKNLAGKDIALSAYQGRVVVVNFWATWCGPCQMETPWLVELREKYQARGVEIIGISVDALDADYDKQDIRAFIKEHKVKYPIALATQEVVEAYGPISGIPATIVIDRTGQIQARHRGLIPFDKLESEIKQLL